MRRVYLVCGTNTNRSFWEGCPAQLYRTVGREYVELRKAMTTDSTEDLESHLRGVRDDGVLWGSWGSMSKISLCEGASSMIAQRICRGLEGCVSTVVAACSLPRGSGEKKIPPGVFRSSINPSNHLAVAYYTLSSMIEEKAQFKECVGCGELFRLDLKVQHSDRTYCDYACYDRTRKRKQRAKNVSQHDHRVQQLRLIRCHPFKAHLSGDIVAQQGPKGQPTHASIGVSARVKIGGFGP